METRLGDVTGRGNTGLCRTGLEYMYIAAEERMIQGSIHGVAKKLSELKWRGL
jgi:hypothetical protein